MSSALAQKISPFILVTKFLDYQGETYTYAVIARKFSEVHPTPEVYAIHSVDVLAVSETYPEEWQDLCIIHEVVEYKSPASETSCLEALKTELALAEAQKMDMNAYIAFRTMFFDKLITFYKGGPDFLNKQAMMDRFGLSLQYLRTLA